MYGIEIDLSSKPPEEEKPEKAFVKEEKLEIPPEEQPPKEKPLERPPEHIKPLEEEPKVFITIVRKPVFPLLIGFLLVLFLLIVLLAVIAACIFK